jgi:Zn-dependent peptidase ImmA (M78 family)
MGDKKTISRNLKRERETLGYTLKQVSDKMGYRNYQTLRSIEAGHREVKAWELAKLAGIYNRAIDFFMSEEYAPSEPRVLWRTPSETTERLRSERRFISYCKQYHRLLELTGEIRKSHSTFSLEAPNKQEFRKRPYDYVVELADEFRRILNMGGRPAHSLSDVLEQVLGVMVFYLDLGDSGSAASTVGDFGKAILINSSDAPWRRNYDLAHEFFHLITWDIFSNDEIYSTSSQGKPYVEQWADAFASVLLLPSEEVRKEFLKRVENKNIEFISLVEIAREFRVSIEALLWRLVTLGLIKRKDVLECLENGRIKDIDRKMRVAEWIEERPYLSTRYIALAIKALQAGKLSKAKFAEHVDRPFSEISSFLKKNGYDENEDYSVAFATS